MNKTIYSCVVSIAGTDPSGGAGIQADIKAISATGSYAASVITALVAQNTQGVQGIQCLPTDFISLQINSVFNDLTVHAVKIGMLHNEKIMEAVLLGLRKFKPKYCVLDPVMIAKSGDSLLEFSAIQFLKEKFIPSVTLITPNLPEAEYLLGEKISNFTAMEKAVKKMSDQFNVSVLLKGGHAHSKQCSDVLYDIAASSCTWFHAAKIKTHNTHGTGCTLSAAIASYLAQQYSLKEAVSLAKAYLTQAIQAAKSLQIGKGHGPVDHFYFLKKHENNI
jgi:hydroxymethylpyrimidine/phosphomethylpyrimidine kinase